MAAIVGPVLVSFGNKRAITVFALYKPAEQKGMPTVATNALSQKSLLDAIKDKFWNQRFMDAKVGFASLLDLDQPDIEWICKHPGNDVSRDDLAASASKTQGIHFLHKTVQPIPSGCVEFKCLPYERAFFGINSLWVSLALV